MYKKIFPHDLHDNNVHFCFIWYNKNEKGE